MILEDFTSYRRILEGRFRQNPFTAPERRRTRKAKKDTNMKRHQSNLPGGLIYGAFAFLFLAAGTNAQACHLGGNALTAAMMNSSAMEKMAAQHAAAARPPEPGTRGNAPASIQGLWQVNVFSLGTVVDMAFEVFHADGTEMINDITPPSQGNVCLGVWTQVSNTQYKLTHSAWEFDANGNLAGTEILTATITLTAEDKFTGTYTLANYNLTGSPGESFSGTLSGTRIQPVY